MAEVYASVVDAEITGHLTEQESGRTCRAVEAIRSTLIRVQLE